MTAKILAHVRLKPNCELENTRASLIMHRIERFCERIDCYPSNLAGNMDAIPYIRDYGFYLHFISNMPEFVISIIKNCFFVESFELIDDESAIPPFEPVARPHAINQGESSYAGVLNASLSEGNEHTEELTKLLGDLDFTQRELSAYAQERKTDQRINAISYACTKAVDSLRTTVALSHLEPFSRIAPSLNAIVQTCSKQYQVAVDFDMIENHIEIDRVVLSSLEEIMKRLIKLCVRDNIEPPEERVRAGKPRHARISLRLEYDGSEIVCRSEHDGRPFATEIFGQFASSSGILTRPLEDYSDDELGQLALLPHFLSKQILPQNYTESMTELSEIGTILQRAGGRGSVRNTDRGTVETTLVFPIHYVALDVVLFTVNDAHLALPSIQVTRFEAFEADRCIQEHDRVVYLDQTETRHVAINDASSSLPLATANPRIVAFLESPEFGTMALGVDSVEGYCHTPVNRLSPVIYRYLEPSVGCVGYITLDDLSIRPVLNARHLLRAARQKGGHHA